MFLIIQNHKFLELHTNKWIDKIRQQYILAFYASDHPQSSMNEG